jgi:hypothetical protein
MNEIEAIQIAKKAADEVGYPWNSASVAAIRRRALVVFPVWQVTSALPEGNCIIRATIPAGAARATRLEMLFAHNIVPARVVRLRIARVVVQSIFVCAIAFAALRRFIPSTLLRDAFVAVGFALLCTWVIETYVAQRAFRRKYHPFEGK